MTKTQFLNELNRSLKGIPDAERKDILRDYDEYFIVGAENGKTEEVVAAGLGSPRQIAKELRATYHLDQVLELPNFSNVFRATLAIVALALFNSVIVLGPFLGLLGLVVGGWMIALGLSFAPIFALLGILFEPIPTELGAFPLFIAITAGGIGLLFGVIMQYISKIIWIGFVRYLTFHVSIVKGGDAK